MIALAVLLGAGLGLLALGPVALVVPRWQPGLAAVACLAGLAAALAALLGGPASMPFGVTVAVDGLSGLTLAALLLTAWAGTGSQPPGWRAPVAAGGLALAMLAADGLALALALAMAAAAGSGARPFDARLPRALRAGRAETLVMLLCLAVALLALGGGAAGFAAMRAGVVDGWRGAAVLAAALGAVALLPRVLPNEVGGLASLYVGTRLLLDLSGRVTPVWWGVPVLLLGAACAIHGARRAAAADSLGQAAAGAAAAAQGVAAAGLGAALLARGADLPPLAALAVAGALLHLLAWALWGGLLTLCAGAMRTMAGGDALDRAGGLLRRMPITALALLTALLSMAAVPLSAGFAGFWMVLQGLFGAGRLGVPGLLLVAGVVSALGLVAALLAVAAVRLGGVALLGAPRTAAAAAAADPERAARAGLAALGGAALLAGLWPGPFLALVQPGARLLTGVEAAGGGWFGLAAAADAPGYAAPALAALLGIALAAAAALARTPAESAAPWQGGLPGGESHATWPLPRRPAWWVVRVDRGAGALAVLAAGLAFAIGWAAR